MKRTLIHSLIFFSSLSLGAEIVDIRSDEKNLIIHFKDRIPGFRSFYISENNQLVFDVMENLNPERKRYEFSLGTVHAVDIVGSKDRGRIVITLGTRSSYEIQEKDNLLIVRFSKPSAEIPQQSIEKVDFRRGTHGEGRIILVLKNPNIVVNTRKKGLRVTITLASTDVPNELRKRWDVADFGTPISYFDLYGVNGKAILEIYVTTDDFDYSLLQTGRVVTVEVRKLTPREVARKKEQIYKGERITLHFQDIPIRAALQILADFSGLNIVADDSVEGNITLRLADVPWDQALEIILRSKGLGKFQTDNVIWIAPLGKIQEYERRKLEQLSLQEEKVPLKTEIIQLNYARADEVAALLVGKKAAGQRERVESSPFRTAPAYTTYFPEERMTGGPAGGELQGTSLLSPRGQVNYDLRTNILIIRDTPYHLEAIRKLIKLLDRPVRQVLIESRIVVANDDFTRRLGVRLNAARFSGRPGQVQTIVGGRGFPENVGAQTTPGGQQGGILPNLPNFGVLDFPAGPGAAGVGIAIFKLNQFLMSLELSALQREGRGEVISLPKVIAQNNTTATIEQGIELPFQSQSLLGGTNIQFKKAVLKLEVKPHITPNDEIIMDLLVTRDTRGEQTPAGPAIDTRKIRTRVQVRDGETVVLGGVFEGERSRVDTKVPFFGDLPGIGFAFRRHEVIDRRRELLIFITPTILKETGP